MTSRVLFRAERLLDLSASIGPVLGLDTGTSAATLGLVANGRVVAELSRATGSHGANLPGAVAELLDAGRIGFGDLAGVAVGIGPGSFTGLRIALSYAKGLVAAAGIAISGVPSLDALALSALESSSPATGTVVCPILDARKGEVYAALYQVVPDGLEKLSDDLVVKLERLFPQIPDNAVLAGDSRAVDACKSLMCAQSRRAIVAAAEPRVGRAIAMVGAARIARGEIEHPVTLEPLYVRPPEATLKAARSSRTEVGTEGIWSRENVNSSNASQPVTRS